MKNTHIYNDWNPEEYHNNSHIQENAAAELLKHINIKQTDKILDIGCGNGKITAKISSSLTTGSTIGIDLSREMINFAKTNYPKQSFPNLDFISLDAQNITYQEEFNIVFSSFAIQWIKDKTLLFNNIYKSLKSHSYLIATIPLGISKALEHATEEIISSAQWHAFFEEIELSPNLTSATDYNLLLVESKFHLEYFAVIQQEVSFSSINSFKKYVLQWYPYLQFLPTNVKDQFFEQIISKYLELEPIQSNNKVKFVFPRLDLKAKKC